MPGDALRRASRVGRTVLCYFRQDPYSSAISGTIPILFVPFPAGSLLKWYFRQDPAWLATRFAGLKEGAGGGGAGEPSEREEAAAAQSARYLFLLLYYSRPRVE